MTLQFLIQHSDSECQSLLMQITCDPDSTHPSGFKEKISSKGIQGRASKFVDANEVKQIWRNQDLTLSHKSQVKHFLCSTHYLVRNDCLPKPDASKEKRIVGTFTLG